MLSFFRRGGAGQIIVGAIVFAIILVFVLEFRAGRGGQGASLTNECAIEVVGRCVSVKEFNAAQGLLAPPYVERKQLRELHLPQRTADGLVERELLLNEAERLGISVSEEVADKELSQGRARASIPAAAREQLSMNIGMCQPDSSGWGCLPGSQGIRLLPVKSSKTGKFDYEIYSRVVRNRTNRSPREFKEMQQRELIAERMRDLVTSRVQVSEGEVFERFKRSRSTARANVVELDQGWFQRFVVNASSESVAHWAAEHKAETDEAWKAEKDKWRAGCPLVVEIKASFGETASDDDKVLLRERLDTALSLLKDRIPFETVAQQLADSSDPAASAPRCLPESAAAELKESVAKLQIGKVSPILETADGFYLLKYVGLLAEAEVENVGRIAVATGLAMPALAQEAVAKAARQLVEGLDRGESLEAVTAALAVELLPPAGQNGEEPLALADKQHPAVRDVPPFTASSRPLPAALPTETYAARAFEVEPGTHLEVALRSGRAVMVVTGKDLATKADFEEAKATLLKQVLSAKQQEALIRYMAELRKAADGAIRILPALVEEPKGDKDSG